MFVRCLADRLVCYFTVDRLTLMILLVSPTIHPQSTSGVVAARDLQPSGPQSSQLICPSRVFGRQDVEEGGQPTVGDLRPLHIRGRRN